MTISLNRRGYYLFLPMVLLTDCAHQNAATVRGNFTPSQEKNVPARILSIPCFEFRNNDLPTLLRSILVKYDPILFAFGELHHDCSTPGSSTIEFFPPEALSVLKSSGFSDSVIEFIPGDPEYRDDLEKFNAGTELSELTSLSGTLNECIDKGYDKFYTACRDQGIRIHAGGLTSEIFSSPELIAEWNSPRPKPNIIKIAGQKMQENLEELLSQHKKVFSYSGLRLNDTDQPAEDGYFGQYYDRKYGNRYVQFDLVSRKRLDELIKADPPELSLYRRKLMEYQKHASPDFNTCINPEPNHFVYILK